MQVLQFGGGNFLRAFLGPALQALSTATGTDVRAVVVKPTERGDYAALRQQNGRYHVAVRGMLDGERVDRLEFIDVVDRVVHPYREWAAFLASATAPELCVVVSNTTEAGIRFVPEDYRADVCPAEFPAKLCRWLQARFEGAGAVPTYILPCELIEANGNRLREAVLAYADHWQLSAEFSTYVTEHCYFANTLVDRIVSGKPPAGSKLYARLPFPDQLLAVAEPYHLWAIAASPELRRAFPLDDSAFNAVFTDDLDKYRTLKVRILNGLHILMVLTGLPAGVETVGAYVADPTRAAWLERVLHEEIIPSLPYPEATCKAYAAEVMDRFRNPFLHHRLADIALNKTEKVQVRLLPTVEAYRARFGRAPSLLGEVLDKVTH